MARGKAISVKIATHKVITALENALAKLEAEYALGKEKEAEYEKAVAEHKEALIKFAMDNFAKAKNFRTSYRSWATTLNIDFDLEILESSLPAEPKREYELVYDHVYTEQKSELENAIRILKMTDEEVVNTSTYNAVARYL